MVRSVQLGLVAQRERRKKLRVFARPETRHSAQAAPSHDCPFAPTPADWPVLRNTSVGNQPTPDLRMRNLPTLKRTFEWIKLHAGRPMNLAWLWHPAKPYRRQGFSNYLC